MNRKDRRAGRKNADGVALQTHAPSGVGGRAPSGGISLSQGFHEAFAFASAGRSQEAWDRCQRILAENPHHPEALHLGGIVSLQMGESRRALRLLQSALALKPQVPEIYSVLGNAQQATGDIVGATSSYRRALEMRPDFAEARINLGNVLHVTGENDAAIAEYQHAIRLNPNIPDAHYNLGVLFKTLGRREEALASYERAVALAPNHAAAHNNRGVLLKELARLEEAVAAFRQALGIAPNFPECLDNLGSTLVLLGRTAEALDHLSRAVALKPAFVEAQNHLGLALLQQGDVEGAITCLRRALDANPDLAEVHGTLSRALESLNRVTEAKASASRAIALLPEDRQANLVMARIDRREGRLQEALARLLPFSRTGAVDELGVEIRFDLGQVYDRLGQSSDAFRMFAEGNRLAVQVYGDFKTENEAYLRKIDHLAKTYTSAWARTWTTAQPMQSEQTPVFLIGFPRSGTTLLDQILDSHPKLQTIEEKPAVYAMVTAAERMAGGYPNALPGLTAAQIESLRRSYFDTVHRFLTRQAGTLLIDKFPLATIHAGLIKRVFPEARFIVALRHPCDVCLSCFMQSFRLNDAMASFVSLKGAADLYAKVMGLWGDYRRALPLAHHVVRYEDLVAEPEAEARRLLEFLDVPWDDAVLRHSEHAKARGRINTPSYHQVAEPIYTRASGRWKRYQAELAPVMSVLQPFIEEFGYAEA